MEWVMADGTTSGAKAQWSSAPAISHERNPRSLTNQFRRHFSCLTSAQPELLQCYLNLEVSIFARLIRDRTHTLAFSDQISEYALQMSFDKIGVTPVVDPEENVKLLLSPLPS